MVGKYHTDISKVYRPGLKVFLVDFLLLFLRWVSITLICQLSYTGLGCRGNCLNGTTFTSYLSF